MAVILPVASGKGGVGKSILVANIGAWLASYGNTVILIDLDLGGANLHTFLGVKNRHSGIGGYVYKKEDKLESLLVNTHMEGLYLIPGDSLLPGTANLPFFRKQKIIREINNLTADYIILDLSAGSSFNTADFFLLSPSGIIVTTLEITSVLNACGFLKTVLYRLIFRSFSRNSEERLEIHNFITSRIESSKKPFSILIESL